MKQYGLLGYPLSHSFSRAYFNEKFKVEGIDASYQNFAIPSIKELPRLISDNPQLVGLNVTIPYKQTVLSYLDCLDSEAEAIGAINVIRIKRNENGDTRLIGYNSDIVGFRESIRPYVETIRNKIDASIVIKALILGTGGVSKAIERGLKQLGVETIFVSRHPSPGRLDYYKLNERNYNEYSIIVNATPLGMIPDVDTCPPLIYESIGPDHLLFDAVYNPEKTLFLKKGEEQGATIKNGLEMLYLQADAAWKIWNA
jgi:shikimate dehydrogenase